MGMISVAGGGNQPCLALLPGWKQRFQDGDVLEAVVRARAIDRVSVKLCETVARCSPCAASEKLRTQRSHRRLLSR